ncbi:hypothetical protein AGABI1DRAFT_135275 [Agaricus bisporus var. burnettii JB137-S8]|uniref:Uncharacterized protein n=1 Tax=Agaricus bisporus var. burnettii (strain JB137-S8 / ATCC MYA-4627 / FGSC 10392) TaxID=597362 RepID=K5WDC9_AGABU|nr:uncharacterized protein AGABI1DRAFT_135275 [Agaricus bisporus var. burnettii JB137-S8]EKM73236.1 hypothetical protein AGABI1DRAFT_135275 [Agaricus bisporus var. burnettii JB137-S8]
MLSTHQLTTPDQARIQPENPSRGVLRIILHPQGTPWGVWLPCVASLSAPIPRHPTAPDKTPEPSPDTPT